MPGGCAGPGQLEEIETPAEADAFVTVPALLVEATVGPGFAYENLVWEPTAVTMKVPLNEASWTPATTTESPTARLCACDVVSVATPTFLALVVMLRTGLREVHPAGDVGIGGGSIGHGFGAKGPVTGWLIVAAL